jgi:hypothetical protein
LKRDDLVGADVKLAPPSAFVAGEEAVDEGEDLLHDCILANVVVSLELWERVREKRVGDSQRTNEDSAELERTR